MTAELERRDFEGIVDILMRSSEMQTTEERVWLVRAAFPSDREIVSRIDFHGSTKGFVIGLIRHLSYYGSTMEGEEALGVFLKSILSYVSAGDAEYIKSILEKYALGPPAVSARISQWRGPAQLRAETVFRAPSSWSISSLSKAFKVARAVARVDAKSAYGEVFSTGFLVGPNILIAPNHVIDDRTASLNTTARFGYEKDPDGVVESGYTVSVSDGGIFHTNKSLDYTLVQLSETPPGISPLSLGYVSVEQGEPVILIHHSGGGPKQISIQNNVVEYVDQFMIQYITDSVPGSSGAPVFNQDFQVIAMHQAISHLQEPTTRMRYFRNQAVRISAILEDLKLGASSYLYELVTKQARS